jgi:hypothetical protein
MLIKIPAQPIMSIHETVRGLLLPGDLYSIRCHTDRPARRRIMYTFFPFWCPFPPRIPNNFFLKLEYPTNWKKKKKTSHILPRPVAQVQLLRNTTTLWGILPGARNQRG